MASECVTRDPVHPMMLRRSWLLLLCITSLIQQVACGKGAALMALMAKQMHGGTHNKDWGKHTGKPGTSHSPSNNKTLFVHIHKSGGSSVRSIPKLGSSLAGRQPRCTLCCSLLRARTRAAREGISGGVGCVRRCLKRTRRCLTRSWRGDTDTPPLLIGR